MSGSDQRHDAVLDMVGELEQPPASAVMRVTEILRDALRKEFQNVGSGFGCGEADLDVTIDGFHVWVTIRPSSTQKLKSMQ